MVFMSDFKKMEKYILWLIRQDGTKSIHWHFPYTTFCIITRKGCDHAYVLGGE